MRAGVDIGGTFTDVVLFDEDSHSIRVSKTLAEPADLARSVRDGLAVADVPLDQISSLIHGSTMVINALLERKGAKTALITTKGFRDIYEIGRINRPDSFNPAFKKHRPLIPRHMIFEVPGRMLADGTEREPLDEDAARGIAAILEDENVEAVAILLLHSYRSPDHEIRLTEILKASNPRMFVTASHEITREYREYERTSTVAANAYVGPKVDAYLGALQDGLRRRGFGGEFLIMQSNGGLSDVELARRQCIQMMESGPAGGVIGAVRLADILGLDSVIALDIGGTTAKTSAIRRGEPTFAPDYFVGGYNEGLVVRVPVLDIVEVGTGGGSVAWIDDAGALHVGPLSAGAEPGPASYGRGGTRPTTTDANVVLGRLAPEAFLGGSMPLDPIAAQNALRTHLAEPMQLDVERVAEGILEVATAAAANAIRQVTVRRGLDPRDFTLIAYGGNGPMEAAAIAQELSIGNIVIPQAPGVFSALGMLAADLRHDYVQTMFVRLDDAHLSELERELQAIEAAALATINKSGRRPTDVTYERAADMRYVGQEHTVAVLLPSHIDDEAARTVIKGLFDAAHEQRYNHSAPDESAEIVSVRVSAIGQLGQPRLPRLAEGMPTPPDAARKGARTVTFPGRGRASATVWDRSALRESNTINGPAVIEEEQSTTLVPPGYKMTVHGLGHLLISALD
jgi:N-methylhydantoinase A